jgi:hypothetical protein
VTLVGEDPAMLDTDDVTSKNVRTTTIYFGFAKASLRGANGHKRHYERGICIRDALYRLVEGDAVGIRRRLELNI